MDSGIIIGIVGIAVTIIIGVTPFIYKRIKEKKAPYTGIWEDKIYDTNNNMVKKDYFYLKQKGNIITGTAKRVFPENQNYRRYEVYGRLSGKDFVAIFWATDRSVLSYGCWFITQVNDSTFKGHYLKMSKDRGNRSPSKRADLVRSNKSVKDFNKIP